MFVSCGSRIVGVPCFTPRYRPSVQCTVYMHSALNIRKLVALQSRLELLAHHCIMCTLSMFLKFIKTTVVILSSETTTVSATHSTSMRQLTCGRQQMPCRQHTVREVDDVRIVWPFRCSNAGHNDVGASDIAGGGV